MHFVSLLICVMKFLPDDGKQWRDREKQWIMRIFDKSVLNATIFRFFLSMFL